MADIWTQGRLLMTRDVQNWTDEQRTRAAAVEARMVFRHFTDEDEGRSRVRVAIFDRPEDAAAVVAAYNAAQSSEALPAIGDAVEPLDPDNYGTGQIDGFTSFTSAHGVTEQFTVAWPRLRGLPGQPPPRYTLTMDKKTHRLTQIVPKHWRVERTIRLVR